MCNVCLYIYFLTRPPFFVSCTDHPPLETGPNINLKPLGHPAPPDVQLAIVKPPGAPRRPKFAGAESERVLGQVRSGRQGQSKIPYRWQYDQAGMLMMMNQGRAAETACDAFGSSMVDETSSEHHFPKCVHLLLSILCPCKSR